MEVLSYDEQLKRLTVLTLEKIMTGDGDDTYNGFIHKYLNGYMKKGEDHSRVTQVIGLGSMRKR